MSFYRSSSLLMYAIVVILSLPLMPTLAKTRYDRDELLLVSTFDNFSSVISIMQELGPEIEFWQLPNVVDVDEKKTEAQIYATRKVSVEFRVRLDRIGVRYETLIDDIQRLVDEEKLSMVNALLEKRKRRLRKRDTTLTSSDIVGLYPTYKQLYKWLGEMIRQHSDICSLYNIGLTAEQRSIYVIKISDSSVVEKPRPAIWIDAGIHAREWISVSSAVYVIQQLIKTMSSTNESVEIDDGVEIDDDVELVRNWDWYIAPLLNPDGYAFAHHTDGNRFWRKNRVLYNDSGFSLLYNRTCIGVDLNRNFNFQWHSVERHNEPCFVDYSGPFASSELETRAVTSFILARRQSLQAMITMHNYGQLLLSRWAFTNDFYPPEHNETMELLAKSVNAIYKTTGRNYTYGTAPDILYKFSGGLGDWARGIAGIKYSFELELPDRGHFGFLLPANYVLPVGAEIWSAVKVIAASVVEERQSTSRTTSSTFKLPPTPGPSRRSTPVTSRKRNRTPGPFTRSATPRPTMTTTKKWKLKPAEFTTVHESTMIADVVASCSVLHFHVTINYVLMAIVSIRLVHIRTM